MSNFNLDQTIVSNSLVSLTEKEMEQAQGGMGIGEWIDKNYKELKGAIIDAYNDAMSQYHATH